MKLLECAGFYADAGKSGHVRRHRVTFPSKREGEKMFVKLPPKTEEMPFSPFRLAGMRNAQITHRISPWRHFLIVRPVSVWRSARLFMSLCNVVTFYGLWNYVNFNNLYYKKKQSLFSVRYTMRVTLHARLNVYTYSCVVLACDLHMLVPLKHTQRYTYTHRHTHRHNLSNFEIILLICLDKPCLGLSNNPPPTKKNKKTLKIK